MLKSKQIILMTLVFILSLPVFALAGGVIVLPETGQTACYDTAGTAILCAGTGQDGDILAGAQWPNPRFTDKGDGTVRDNLTGLVWTKDANAPGPAACSPATSKFWHVAIDYVGCLNKNSYLGYTDWRLPNINELMSLFSHAGQKYTDVWLNTQGFNNVQNDVYWSSTLVTGRPGFAWQVIGWDGALAYHDWNIMVYAWPVRSEQSGLFGSPVIQLPRTGQTTCYDYAGTVKSCAGTGQDGDLQKGIEWPNPRFTDNGNSTVTDNLTGLVWTKDAYAPGPVVCSPATSKTWQDALDYIACLNANSYLGYTDWRMPNFKELMNLLFHAGQFDAAAWLNTQGFNNVQSLHNWWSSTSYVHFVNVPKDALVFTTPYEGYYLNRKQLVDFVWPVRSGQLAVTDPAPLPKTGQTTCYNSAGVIPCAGTGQDGNIQAGASLPNPRFTDKGDGTMTDKLTGLAWTKDGYAAGPAVCSPGTAKTWQGALDYVACLNTNSFLGYADWRMPNFNELRSLVDYGQPNIASWLQTQGFNAVSSYYWSSTTLIYPDHLNIKRIVRMGEGNSTGLPETFGPPLWNIFVWPVRSGQSGLFGSSIIQLPSTGQTTCYNSAGVIPCAGTGQDGESQKGFVGPSPRFKDNGNSTVTDNLTGLVWTKDGNAPGPAACSPATTKTWQGALDFAACLNLNNYLGYTDWRLPNNNELWSLINAGEPDSAAWLNTHGFFNVQSNNSYWSSTSEALAPKSAGWIINFGIGTGDNMIGKSYNGSVWPVRSGQIGHLDHSVFGKVKKGTRGLSGVTMTLSGTASAVTTTAGDGTYSFTKLADGNYTIRPVMTGYDFTPTDRIVTIAGDDATAQDYSACIQDTVYRDADGDGFGNAADTMQSCTLPIGYVYDNTDCNDNIASVNPGAVEVCGNGIDDNCNGQIDEGCFTDLIVFTLTAPNTAVPGQSITLTESTKNQGTAGAGASTTKYYWPANPNPILLGSRSVPALTAGATSSGTTSVTIPSFTCSGMKTIYIKAAADADGVIAESDETNNNKWRAVKMGPDLIIPTLTAPNNAGSGKTINISDTVKNNGGCTAGASTTKLFFSLDAILDAGDTLLGSRAVPLLTAGAASSGTTAVTIPAGTATGKYYIIAYSDADNVVAETFEGNNKKVKVINILPDLIVSILSAPNTAGAGAVIAISDTTKNIGGSSAAASTTSFYFSTDTIFDAGDTLLGIRAIPALAAGAINSGTTSITIPAGTLSGTYYIIGRSDADAVVPETIEGNNNKSRIITVP